MARVVNPSQGVRPLTELLSTITSPVFSDLVLAVASREARLPWAVPLFRGLRAMNEIRHFKLGFFLESTGYWEVERNLVEVLDIATELGLVDPLDSPPAIGIARLRSGKWHFLDFD